MYEIRKYPRTPHIQGSRFQHGDYDLEAVPFAEIAGKPLIVEEKVDGSQAGISFEDEKLMLQSRGHYLRGGPRERQYDLLKQQMNSIVDELYYVLDERYVMYGEWLYAKHSVYYDALPDYFMEFDIYDKQTDTFLSEQRRMDLLASRSGINLPITSVRVLYRGAVNSLDELKAMIGPSAFVTNRRKDNLVDVAKTLGLDVDRVIKETDLDPNMEGLYVKWEEDGIIKGRYKFVRQSFTCALLDSGTHWHSRPIVPNGLVIKHHVGI
jgi:phosphoglycolate phosphatase-like HAD superfamily hydrolase